MRILTFIAPGLSPTYTQHLAETLGIGSQVLSQQGCSIVQAAGLGVASWGVLHQHICSATPPYDCLIVAGNAMSFVELPPKGFDRTKQPARTTLAAWVGETGPRDLFMLREAGFQHIVRVEEGPLALFRAILLAQEEKTRLIEEMAAAASSLTATALPVPDAKPLTPPIDSHTPARPLKTNLPPILYKGTLLHFAGHLHKILVALIKANGTPVDLSASSLQASRQGVKVSCLRSYVSDLRGAIRKQTGLSKKEMRRLLYQPAASNFATYVFKNEEQNFTCDFPDKPARPAADTRPATPVAAPTPEGQS